VRFDNIVSHLPENLFDYEELDKRVSITLPSTFVVPHIPTIAIPMANPPNMMYRTVATRYAPMVLFRNLYSLPQGDYLKYVPKLTREEEVTTKEHLASICNYADNQNIEHEYVWTILLVQSLDGEARKWFRALLAGSIVGIDALD
jgi:hypothetical protein